MKKFYSLLTSLLILCIGIQNSHAQTNSKPLSFPSNCIASPIPVDILQADSTSITIVGKGNMNNNWTETTDGYSVVRNNAGIYEYAKKQSGELVPDGVKARNPNSRTVAEQNYLVNVSLSLKPDLNPLKSSVLNQVKKQIQNKTFPASGNIKVLALLIDYPDLTNTYDTSDFDSLLYGVNFRNGDGSFKVFYETSSDSQLTVDVDVYGWFRADSNYLYYGADSGYDKAADLVREAVDAAETAGVDFSLYDNDNNNRVDGILAVHAGPGAEQGARTQYIWSHRWVLNGGNLGSVTYDGVTINDYMINPETRTSGATSNLVGIGVFCHEFGHNLGLPDLYDTDNTNGDSEGIGEWGLMGSAGYLGNEHRPGNFCAWAKEELNWISPTLLTIGNTGLYTLDAASTNLNEVFRINTSQSNEYFLLENRQKTGLDSDLNGEGLAIWHINTDKTNAFGNSVNADETLKGVDLEEADGNSDLDNETNRGDNGDLFPGSSSNSTFDSNSIPNSNNYLLNNSGLEIRNISESSGVLSFAFGPAPGPPCAANTTLTASSGSFSDGSSDSLEYANNQNCNWLIQVSSGIITLNFSYFRTEANTDSVTVYDGINASSPLLGNFSGTSIPSAVTSSGSDMYIEFNTNSSISDTGWVANYTSSPAPIICGTDTLSSTFGTFEDGSDTANYDNNLNCSWLIAPPQATSIEISFNRFDTELTNDSVSIYDGTSSAGTLIATFSGNTIPSNTTINSGNAFIEFITNSSDTASGWEISYTSSPTCGGTITLTDSAGSFEDGSSVNNYDNSLNCVWIIEPDNAPATITFTMDSIDLNGFGDFVRVRDGDLSTSPIIGFFFGTNTGNTVTAFSGKMRVEFITNGTGTGKGFNASYTTSDTYCNNQTVFTGASGFFNDGSPFGRDYLNNTDCSWLIQPSTPNRRITLTFFGGAFNFNTQANIDTVTIYDGPTTNSPILRTLSGTPGFTTINSSGGSMLITFKSDSSITAGGWRANYTTSLAPSCAGTTSLTTANGTFDDGSADSLVYSENNSCNWLIQPPGATKIALQFSRFKTESANDFVRVYDGNNSSAPLLGTFSGSVLPPSIISSGGSLFVQFTTNATINETGWEANYTSTSNQCFDITLNLARDTIDDGSGTSNYDNNLNCTWLLEPVSAIDISLNFTEFDLNTDDTLKVYDGSSSAATLLGAFTGNTLPSTQTSTGSTMFIEFITNGSNTATGWKAFYDITSNLSCVGTTNLTALIGNIEDGSGTANYDINLNCGWLIQPPNVSTIQFTMDSMQLGSGDQINVYAGNNPSGTLLRTYTGTSFSGPVKASTGSMFIEFISDNANTGSGWAGNYSSSSTFCLPNTVLTALNANFEDGSPTTTDYANNSDCEWLIQPSNPNVIINLRFFRFSTASIADSVTVYDGSTTNDSILGTFYGNRFSSVTSTGNTMLVTFKTDSSNTATGWRANYRTIATPPCQAPTTLTAMSDTFTDGSLDGNNYAPNTSCTWLIQPTNALSIDLNFNRFETQSVSDFITVYDGSSNSAPSLGTFSGQASISTLSSTGGSLFIEFTTDGILELNGWEASYTANIDTITASPDTIFLGDQINSTNTFNITTSSSWTSADNAGWLSVSPVSGTGNATGTAEAIQANLLNQERIGEIYINSSITNSSDTIIVVQRSNGNILSISPDTLYFDGNPLGGQNATVSSNVNWNLTSTATWITVGTTSGVNNGSSIVSVSTNSTSSLRSAFVILSGTGGVVNDTMVVVQDTIVPLPPSLSVDPNSLSIASPSGSNASFDVNSNVVWQTTAGDPWLTITNPTSTVDTNTVQISSNTANTTTTSRTSYVAVQDVNGTLFDTVFVTQLGNNTILSVSPNNLTLNNPQGSNASASLAANINWTASIGASWLSASPLSGNSNANITVTANSANLATTDRVSFVALEGGGGAIVDTIFITQIAAPQTLSVSPNSVALAQAANSTSNFTINSNVDWQTLSGAPWLTIGNPAITSDTGVVQLTANSMNMNPLPRTTFVAVQDISGTLFDTVQVSQLGSNPVLSTNPDTIVLAETVNNNATFNLVSNGDWKLIAGDLWLSPSPSVGSGNASITVTSNSANPNLFARVSFIAIEDTLNNLLDTIIVVQDAQKLQLSTSPDTIRIGAGIGSQGTFNVDAPAQTSWNSSPNDNWINLSQTSGIGNSTILVTANSANTSKIDRTTFIVSTDNGFIPTRDTVYVIQSGVSSNLSVSPSNLNLNFNSGSNDIITVTSNENWTVSNPVTWLSVSPSSGSNDGTVTATTNSDNLSGNNRSAMLTFSATGLNDKIVNVTQIDGSQPNFAVSRDTVYVDNPQGSTATFAVLSNINNWSITENTPWLLVNPLSGSNTQTITVLVATKNVFGNDRSAEVTVSAAGFNDKVVTIIQRASNPLFQIAPTKLFVGPNIGDFNDFNISSNLTGWNVTASEFWMSVSPTSGSFTAQLRVTAVAQNNTGNIRNGLITVEAAPLVPQTIIVTQDTVRTIGLNTVSIDAQMKIYPNPTRSNVTIEFSDKINSNEINFALYSALGSKIQNLNVSRIGNKAELKLENLAKGIYFLQLNYQGMVISRKISVID
ncbi:MAG: CUB domain-containing protein [Vicingaceae bacterium]